MVVILYGLSMSAPYRTDLMTLEILGVPYEIKETILKDGDHLKPEFVKVRGIRHTVEIG